MEQIGRTKGVDDPQRDELAERGRAELPSSMSEKHHHLAHSLRISTMGEMSAGIAHELNQPLSAIRNYVNGLLIQARYVSENSPDADVLMEISREVDRAAGILRRVRDFPQKIPYDSRSVPPHEVAQEAIQFVAHEARKRQCRIECRIDEKLPNVRIDPIQIQQVLVNLLENALEAMEAIPESERFVVIEGEVREGMLLIQVVDHGPGLGPRKAERYFQPFITTKQNGLGMGLAISRGIVEAHGGKLTAMTDLSQGCGFRFSLPLDETAIDGKGTFQHRDAPQRLAPPHVASPLSKGPMRGDSP